MYTSSTSAVFHGVITIKKNRVPYKAGENISALELKCYVSKTGTLVIFVRVYTCEENIVPNTTGIKRRLRKLNFNSKLADHNIN